MKKKRDFKMNGISQIKVDWKWYAIILTIFLVYMSGVSWMFLIAANARPATVHSGGY